MVATRQFGACFLVMLATGAILLATTQFLPQLVQQDFGYTATWAGLVLSPGGVVTMVMMFVIGRLLDQGPAEIPDRRRGRRSSRISMYGLTDVYGDVGFWFFAQSRMLLGVGLPLIFLSIMTASYDGIPPDKTDQASALINVARNTGGSHRRLARRPTCWRIASSSIRAGWSSTSSRRARQYQETLQQVTDYFARPRQLAGRRRSSRRSPGSDSRCSRRRRSSPTSMSSGS